jgi:hypothetical protein
MRENQMKLCTVVHTFLLCQLVANCLAEEKLSPTLDNEVVVLKLTDFKAKPSKSLTNPGAVFVYDDNEERLCFYANLAAEATFMLKADAEYDVIVTAAGDSAMDTKPKFKLMIDDKDVGKETSLKTDAVKMYRTPVTLKAGEHKLSIVFTNDIYKEGEYDSNLYVHGVKLTPHRRASEKMSK